MKQKIIIFASILTISSGLCASDAYKEFDYEKVISSNINKTIKNINKLDLENHTSLIMKQNKIIDEIEEQQRVKFFVKSPKKIDIYIRENYSVIEDNYILKNPAGWRRILIKQKNIWE